MSLTYNSDNWLKTGKASGMLPVNWLPERELEQKEKHNLA